MDSFKKSYKSQNSYKHSSKNSNSGLEELSMLCEQEEDGVKFINLDNNRGEVVVKIDGSRDVKLAVESENKMWRQGSYDYWKERNSGEMMQQQQQGNSSGGGYYFCQQQSPIGDPPSSQTGKFMQKQKAPVSETSLNVDVDMLEIQQKQNHPNIDGDPREKHSARDIRVSFQSPSMHRTDIGPENIRRRSKGSSDEDEYSEHGSSPNSEEVLKCTSNSSFRHNSGLLRSKTKSRLLDPPFIEDEAKKSGRLMKSGPFKSEMLGKIDDDDEDPFLDEDFPEDFKKDNFTFITILQWISFFIILIAFISTLTIPSLSRLKLWNLHILKWEVLVLALICGRLVSGWGIRIIVFVIERNFLLRKRVLYFVYGVRKAVQNCLWLGQVLFAWYFIFIQTRIKTKTLHYTTKILICCLVTTLVWLVKTLLVKVLASSFHVSTYFDRIQDSLFNQYVIETLSGPPLVEIQHIKKEEEKIIAEVQRLQNAGAKIPADLRAAVLPCKSGRVIGGESLTKSSQFGKSMKLNRLQTRRQDEGVKLELLYKLNQKNVSAWNMKRFMNIVRHGTLSTIDEQITGAGYEDESSIQIQSEYAAKVAAKKIFNNVAKPGSKHIYLVDLLRFMREDEAIKTMGFFEGATENKRVTKTALKNWVVNAFRERRALSLTLNDTKTAIKRLHQVLNIVIGVIVLVISLLILEIATTQFLVFISSQLVLVAFIFGNTCKTIFEAIIFLFVMHPYDVGDRCEIDGVQMVVEEMNILTTIFLRYDNQKITYPNSQLSILPISNFYRSPDMGESIDFCVHVSTPLEKISIMKERIKEFIEGRKEHWYPNPAVVMRDIEDMNRLKFSVWSQHRMNHQDMGERHMRRACVVEEMVKIFKELDVDYRMLPVDVNLKNMPPLTSSRYPSTWNVCS